jgi:WD40 repeat protein
MPHRVHPLQAAIVRIRADGDQIAGVGFLAAERHVLTCAHVVAQALGVPEDAPDPPVGTVRLDFPLLHPDKVVKGHVVRWLPVRCGAGPAPTDGEDIAVLEMDEPPPDGACPAPVVAAEDLWGHNFRAFGFPVGYDDGVWTPGVLRDRLANGWVQIEDINEIGYFVAPGFSGGPIWDDAERAVVGMAVSADGREQLRAAFAIPTPLLLRAWPALDPLARPPCPYRGLLAFREEDARFFFGREAFTEQLAAAVAKRSLVTVIGSSGSGKSSVVFAGLAPRLRADGWLVVPFRPSDRPFQALAAALVPLLERGMSETDRLIQIPKLAHALHERAAELGDVLHRIREMAPAAPRLLLIADQFEEIYTLCRDTAERRAFLDILLGTCVPSTGRPDPEIVAVLTMRADFVDQALSDRAMTDALQGADLKLGPMTEEELRSAIEKPAELLKVTLEPGLSVRILEDLREEPGCLPLLEFALTRLWEQQRTRRLTHAAYDAIGGVKEALTRHAEAVYGALGEGDEDRARRVFVQLVRPGEGTTDTRRLATRSELGEQAWSLVTQLANERLVVTGHDEATGEETVEVVHEALIEGWDRLRGWMERDREFRAWQEQLRAAQRQWEASGRDEGALLRGVRLAKAEDWLGRRAEDLGEAERAYVIESAVLRDRERRAMEAEQAARRRQSRQIMAGLVGFSLLALALAGLALLKWSEADWNAQIARHVQLVAQAARAVETQFDLGLLLALDADRQSDTIEARDTLFAAVHANPRLIGYLHGHSQNVNAVAFRPHSSDGQTILASASKDGYIDRWNVETGHIEGKRLGPLKNGININALAYSSDGAFLASGGWTDQPVILWDADAGDPLCQGNDHQAKVTSVAFSPVGNTFASGDVNGVVILWDWGSAPRVPEGSSPPCVLRQRLDPQPDQPDWPGQVLGLSFSPNGARLAAGGCAKLDKAGSCLQGEVRLWDLADGQPAREREPLVSPTDRVHDVAFSPDGQTLVSSGEDGSIILWDPDQGKKIWTAVGHAGTANGLAFSPDGQTLASGGADKIIVLWDVGTGKQRERLVGHTGAVTSVAFSPDGATLASSGWDMAVILWEVGDNAPRGEPLDAYHGEVSSVAFSSDGSTLAAGTKNGTVVFWDVATGQPRDDSLPGHPGWITALAYNPAVPTVFAAAVCGGLNPMEKCDHGGQVYLWNLANRQQLRQLRDSGGGVIGVASITFSANGATLASADCENEAGEANTQYCTTGAVRLWNTATGEIRAELLEPDFIPVAVAFSPDGSMLAAAGCGGLDAQGKCSDGAIRLWDIDPELGAPLRSEPTPLERHTNEVTGLAFSPDGHTLISGSADGALILWSLPSGEPRLLPKEHNGDVTGVAVARDAAVLASGSKDPGSQERNLVLWDLATGEALVHAPVVHLGPVNAVALSPDGQTLASGSADGTVILWHADIGSLATLACDRAGRNLRPSELDQFGGNTWDPGICPSFPLGWDRGSTVPNPPAAAVPPEIAEERD